MFSLEICNKMMKAPFFLTNIEIKRDYIEDKGLMWPSQFCSTSRVLKNDLNLNTFSQADHPEVPTVFPTLYVTLFPAH